MGAMVSQVTGVTSVYSPVCSGADQKVFPFDDAIMYCWQLFNKYRLVVEHLAPRAVISHSKFPLKSQIWF